ncbi:transcription factor C2H2 protein [Rutstroemia sp. NJR-2017a WRK4]|nr:transcription factor C2H2 protein [Rutstroemia sp. NJR-2017a WRK4]
MILPRIQLLLATTLWYMVAKAVLVQPQQYGEIQMENGLSPRYYAGLENARLVDRGTGVCPSDSHSYLYRCPLSLGGGCCALTASCVTGSCAVPLSTSTTPPPLVTAVPSGCNTSQIACASSLGGGCCGIGYRCAVLSGENYCTAATGTRSASRTGMGVIATGGAASEGDNDDDDGDDGKSKGLSTGAKAGIGVGIAGAVLLLLGLGIWCVKLHRRRAAQKQRELDEMAENSTTAHSHSVAGSKRPSAGGRGGSDYFSQKQRKMGPYEDDVGPGNGMGMEGHGHGHAHSRERGVPLTPQSPNDIVVPVEIGSAETSPGWEGMGVGRDRVDNMNAERNRGDKDQGGRVNVTEMP